ncbi:hypothetical protein EB052_01130 [bacterium]|nr:hypothetical protein [bacterium]
MGFLFLGIPSSWHKVVAVLTGLIIVSIALSLRPEQSRPTAPTISPAPTPTAHPSSSNMN